MDLLAVIIIGIVAIIVSKDAYVEDKNASIQDIITNIDNAYSSELGGESIDITEDEQEKMRESFLKTEEDIDFFNK